MAIRKFAFSSKYGSVHTLRVSDVFPVRSASVHLFQVEGEDLPNCGIQDGDYVYVDTASTPRPAPSCSSSSWGTGCCAAAASGAHRTVRRRGP